MISIRKSVNDLDRLEDLEKREKLSGALLECYSLAINSSANYAVEVDPGIAVDFRNHLKTIEEQSRIASSGEQLRALQSSFRGELREYRDKSAEHLKGLRKELEDATVAMQIFADTVASAGENHEQEVTNQLRTLEFAAKGDNIEQIRGGIGTAVAGIESSVVEMQRTNQMVIAQLQDEIRVLHQQIELERKAIYTDRASGAWNRQKVDTHLENLLRQNRPFCLLMVWIRNYKRLETQHSSTMVEGTLKAIISRFAALTGDEGVIGRWSKEQFVAILDMPTSRAMALVSEATTKLSGSYAVQENGMSHTVSVNATAGIIERPTGADASTFHDKLEQLSGAISGA